MNKDLKILKKPEAIEPFTLKPRYELNNKGVYFINIKADSNGNLNEESPLHLSDAIHLIGRGIDEQGVHYRVIEWQDRFTRKKQVMAFPQSDIGTNESWRKLQGIGLTVYSGRRKRELLADYLQTGGSNTQWQVTAKTGWNQSLNAYVMANGEVISKKENKIIFNGDMSQKQGYQVLGSLNDWQALIGKYLADNTRLCLAVGTALAAPLMRLLEIESGGFHIFGDSSSGKTTAANIALSVWGKPSETRLTWSGTALSFSNIANGHNDNLMMLDEISQAAPSVVSKTTYQALNGISKAQGAKDGGNRAMSRWRVMMLSTGEKTLDGYVKSAYQEWNAGQNVRLPSIPASIDSEHGIYDTLHDFTDGALLSEHLNDSAELYHGALGYAFIKVLIDHQEESKAYCKQVMSDFMGSLNNISGQARRVANRFGLIAAALELAIKHELLGISTGQGISAIKRIFDDWIAAHGTGKYEDKEIMEQAIAFMQISKSRFVDVSAIGATGISHPHLAGYIRKKEQAHHDEYCIIPKVFIDEIARGFDKDKACFVLHRANWLKEKTKSGRWQHQVRIDSNLERFYVFIGAMPPDDEPEE